MHNPVHITPGTPESDVTYLLYDTPDDTFTDGDVADATDLTRSESQCILDDLHGEGHIGQDGEAFYALDDREDLRRYVASVDELHRMFDKPY